MFRAFDPERDRLVAVKRFQLDVPPERVRELIASFGRLIASNLTHPSLAAPLAAGLDGTAAYLAMDYASGDSLDIAVRDYGPAPPADALRVAAQLAGALDFSAVVNIDHGALHPRDVLLSGDETRFTGIGVARALESIGLASPLRRPYSAPERLAGADWDRRADIFSLAALIHELLWARRIAGPGAKAADALTEIAGANLASLRDVFACALAEARTDRFATALEFADALTAAFPSVRIGEPAAGRRPRRGASDQVGASSAEPRSPLEEQAPAEELAARMEPRLPLDDAEALSVAAPAWGDLDPGALEMARALETPEPESSAMAEGDVMSDRNSASEPGELDLRKAEAARYQDVESAPALVDPLPASRVMRVEPAAEFTETRPPEFMATALAQSRSAVWPLVLALIVGVAIGFAGGYGVGSRDRAASNAAPLSAAAIGSPERDSTEVAVTESQKSTPVGSTGGEARTPAAPAPSVPNAAAERAETTAPKADVTPGRLLVRSTPAGARVFVDGHEYGKTPVAVHDLSHGAHRIRVVREGYGTEERRVVLTVSRPAQSMTVALERDRAQIAQTRKPAAEPKPDTAAAMGRLSGPLTIESRPTGASVYVDGRLVGTTPLQLPDVAAGEHAVRLEHDGYRTWSSSVRIIATEKNRVTASLEK